MKSDKELNERLFVQRESGIAHAPIQREMEFYELVRQGDIGSVTRSLDTTPINIKEGKGTLSPNPFRNLVYHTIVGIAMITRFCVEGGMEPEVAFSLSDMYIQRVDRLTKEEELVELNREMALDYTSRMEKLKKEKLYSIHVVKCVDYIYNHLHERLRVDELAEAVGLNHNYLSKLFKKETGISISAYIRQKKLDAAKNLLKFSEFTYLEIAAYLGFASQSHFIQSFKADIGITPKEYRDKHYRSVWRK